MVIGQNLYLYANHVTSHLQQNQFDHYEELTQGSWWIINIYYVHMSHRYYDLLHEIVVTCQHALEGFEVEFKSKSKLYF